MSYTVIPYTKIIVPPTGKTPEKIFYAPILETYLFYQQKETLFSFLSIVDSGADFCVFPAKFEELIRLKVKEGRTVFSFGVGGQDGLYFHDIQVGVVIKNQIWNFECSVGFSFKMNPKGTGLLGRNGFFDLFSEIAFNQQQRMFRLKGEGSRSLEGFAK